MAADAARVTTGLAIFVKTPGLSPVKTRLGAEIGRDEAVTFHRMAAAAVAGVARAAGPALAPAWAVAEAEALGHPAWSGLPTIGQGEGGLGERMGRVYAALLARHGSVLLVGADSPQMSPALLRQAARAVTAGSAPYTIGPSEDGGFWLFGGRAAVPDRIWTGVEYSRHDTAGRFVAALAAEGVATSLPRLFDADTARELAAVREALGSLPDLVPEQVELLRWLKGLTLP